MLQFLQHRPNQSSHPDLIPFVGQSRVGSIAHHQDPAVSTAVPEAGEDEEMEGTLLMVMRHSGATGEDYISVLIGVWHFEEA